MAHNSVEARSLCSRHMGRCKCLEMPHVGVVPGCLAVSASVGTVATTESSHPPMLPCTRAMNAASPIPCRAPPPLWPAAQLTSSAEAHRQFVKMAEKVTAEQWAAAEPEPGGNKSNILVGHAALRVDGRVLPVYSGIFVSRRSLIGTMGFSSSPIEMKVVRIPASPRGPDPRPLGGDEGRYNAADFRVDRNDLNNVRIPDRHWMGKALPAEEGQPVVKLGRATFALETRVRACTEVQFLEGVSQHLGAAFHRGDVEGVSVLGEMFLLTHFPPCKTNCADLIREVREALPNVQVLVATFNATGNIRPWAGPVAAIRVPRLDVPQPLPAAAPPSVNVWHQRLQALQSTSPTFEANSAFHSPRFTFDPDAKENTPGARSNGSSTSPTP